MSFCTVVNCLDGRAQLPVIRYLQETLGVLFVDSVTEAGPVRSLAEDGDSAIKSSILRRVAVSLEAHDSQLIAVAAHTDCAGNPIDHTEQMRQIAESADFLAASFPGLPVLGLWVDDSWAVNQICSLPGR